jgi:hypothetical protein
MEKYEIKKNPLKVNNKNIEVNYPVKNHSIHEDKVIVLYDPDYQLKERGALGPPFPNLECFDINGNYLWTAELPSNYARACYNGFKILDSLIEAYSWRDIICNIDIETGKVLKRTYTR